MAAEVLPAVRMITARVPLCPAASLLPRRWVRVFNGQLLQQGPPAGPATALDGVQLRGAVSVGGLALDDEELEEIEDQCFAN